MKKPSEMFEGENSSLRKTYDNCTCKNPQIESNMCEEYCRNCNEKTMDWRTELENIYKISNLRERKDPVASEIETFIAKNFIPKKEYEKKCFEHYVMGQNEGLEYGEENLDKFKEKLKNEIQRWVEDNQRFTSSELGGGYTVDVDDLHIFIQTLLVI
jgi:hypothetical protein